ncbi:MAG: sulfatase family protein [Burkholderiales bacterium]
MTRMINKVCLIVCLLAVLALAGDERPVGQARERPPNIIMIYADDLGWGDVGFNGRTAWRTPNLDRLAAQGTVFRRWYSGAVVCAPSRAALLTGKSTIHNGVSANNADLPRQEVTIAEALKPLGYATALFGKWHHGRTRPGESDYVHPLEQGFDEFCGIRVPAVVRWPGQVPAGQVSSEIIQMMDVLPTLLAAAGGRPDPAWRVDGRDMLNVWRGRERAPERTLFWEWRGEGYFQLAALRGDLKLIVTGEDLFRRLVSADADTPGNVINQGEMYDVERDPAERRSVLFEYQPLARQLRAELANWLATETEASKQGRHQRP